MPLLPYLAAGPPARMVAAMVLGALVLGVPHFEGSTTPSLAPKTSEASAQQAEETAEPRSESGAEGEGHWAHHENLSSR